jgi:hypothetical protein
MNRQLLFCQVIEMADKGMCNANAKPRTGKRQPRNVHYIANYFVLHSSSENMRFSVSFLFELVMIRDNRSCLCHPDELFSHEDLPAMPDRSCQHRLVLFERSIQFH